MLILYTINNRDLSVDNPINYLIFGVCALGE